MDHAWAASQLRVFVIKINNLAGLEGADEAEEETYSRVGVTAEGLSDELVSMEPIMRDLMNAAQQGLGAYDQPPQGGWSFYRSQYWQEIVKHRALQAMGIHEHGEEARRRMRPDSPDLVADQLHPWVWQAAEPMWHAGSAQAAVLAAAQSVNARLQQKLGRRDKSDSALCREAFSRNDPAPGQPRLRFPGDRTTDTWQSRQQGGIEFGAGCFEGLRNPAAHEHELDLPEQVALEQLAAFSLLARWINDCAVETVDGADNVAREPGPLSEADGMLTS